jgi:hypothetical protein
MSGRWVALILMAGLIGQLSTPTTARPSPPAFFYVIRNQLRSISVKLKRVGRPATGTEQLYGVRIAEALMKQIMDWAKARSATRSEVIRRLVTLGLKVKK